MTIMGRHTIAETRDLIATVEFRLKQGNLLIASKQPWPTDDAGLAALARWEAFKSKWRPVSDSVATKLTIANASVLTPADVTPCEPEYVKIRCAINKSCDDTHADPGDLFNVLAGVEKVAGRRIDETFRPQPKAGDPDLAGLQKLDAAIKEAEERAAAAKKAAGQVSTSIVSSIPWWGWLGGVAVAGAVGYVYVSPFLPRRR